MTNFFDTKKELKFAMIGSGSWATSLVTLLMNHQPEIYWYIRDQKNIDYIRKYSHPRLYLPTVTMFPDRLRMSSDINEVVRSADVLIFCIPSAFFIGEASKITEPLGDKFVISAIKGFVCQDNITIAEYFNRVQGLPFDRIGVLSGPSHAEEVAMRKLSYLTLSSKHIEVAESLCRVFACEYIKTHPSTDIYGAEYSAALKNVYAIAAGICHGLAYGDNFMSVLITNAYNELVEFLDRSHPDPKRVTSTSAYLGDLLVTSYSKFSRNRTFGNMLGKGYSVKSAQIEMDMVAEGYYAAKCIHEINKEYNLYMPIAEAVYRILYEDCNASDVIRELTEKLH